MSAQERPLVAMVVVEIHDSTGRDPSRSGAFAVLPGYAEQAGLTLGVEPHLHLIMRGRSPLALAIYDPDEAQRAAAAAIATMPRGAGSAPLPLVEVNGDCWRCASAEAEAARDVLMRELGPRWRWPCEIETTHRSSVIEGE